MSEPLATYLHDHLAGARAGVHILETLRDREKQNDAGRFAEALLEEIQADRELLGDLTQLISSGSNTPKEALAWIGEKLTRLKFRYRISGERGVLMALEALGTGIQGKMMLWRTLVRLQHSDDRLENVDFERLIERAQAQVDNLEAFRLDIAQHALSPERRIENQMSGRTEDGA